MTMPSEQPTIFRRVFAPYGNFILLFIGAGFISGGIVHLGEGINWWDGSLLLLGIVLFVLGSYLQEVFYHQKNLQEEGVLAFLGYSLLLSIGVGMASGGTQHFIDTPGYSSLLIPLGVSLGVWAFVLKQGIDLTRSQWMKLVVGVALFGLVLGAGLSFVAGRLPSSPGHAHGASVERAHEPSSHYMTVRNEAEFLQQMIPHHQEAVDTSAFVLTRTTNPELRAFVDRVIDVQAAEIQQMKTWKQAWFGSEYREDGSYMPMMENLSTLSEQVLDQAYIRGMIEHHKGAVQMAEQVLALSPRSEIKELAEAIVRTQTEEIRLLESWLLSDDLPRHGHS